MDIKAEEVLDALRDRGAKTECDQCGSDKFFISEGDDRFVMHIPMTTNEDELPASHDTLPCVAIACGNCGYMRFYARTIIIEIVKKLRGDHA
ncbi:hypothetical protein [Azospirillum palustre]